MTSKETDAMWRTRSELPEALRLADEHEENDWIACTRQWCDEAAAELRRLHAANIDCVNHFNTLMDERTELLEACKTLAGLPDTENWIATLNTAVQQARAAIKQARALDKMADNARELGLDYEPVEIRPAVYGAWQEPPAAPVQEPVAWRVKWPAIGGGHKWIMADKPLMEKEGFVNQALYIAPPTQPAPVQEPCTICGATEHKEICDSPGAIITKTTGCPVHDKTATPPAHPAPDLQAELEATNRQVEILSDALAESRREAAQLKSQPAPVQEVRLWDTQWTNVVNHDNAYRGWDKQDAINHAVKMTEQYIAKNVLENKCPPSAQPAPVQEPEWKQIAEDLRFHGLTLVKTATGYAVLKLGAVQAQTFGEENVELNVYSNDASNGQQRELVGKVEMGQLVGDGAHKSASNPDAKGEIAVIRGVDGYGPMLDWHEHWVNFPVGTKLYTTPPAAQRQFVGLTDEQIESLWDHGMYVHCSGITALRAITRAIEAKLKEKNTP